MRPYLFARMYMRIFYAHENVHKAFQAKSMGHSKQILCPLQRGSSHALMGVWFSGNVKNLCYS